MDLAPEPRRRPPLHLWLAARDISYRDAAIPLRTSYETLRLVCLPFDDEERRVPNKELMERIWRWTAGEIVPASFYDFTQGARAKAGAAA